MGPERDHVAAWKVLLVDDEPAVHELSRLVLADLAFEGQPVELLSAGSAAQAREMLARHADIALVLLDVVMESDDAGVCLVDHIRTERGDHDVQLVLRTGQPGMAPEREVVLHHEINGYCLKTELTAQRLHSVVVSALRAYRHARSLRAARASPSAPSMPSASDLAREAWAAELGSLHASGAVSMLAQPEIALASNQVCGIELVPQWMTSRGLLPVARVAELLPIGPSRFDVVRWLTTRACQWSRTWNARRHGVLTVSVPLVADSVGDPDTLRAILDLLDDAGLPGGALNFQVSPAVLLDGSAQTTAALASLRERGILLTLTGFGAGTLALDRLSRLVPDRLKIHRLFVRDVTADAERMALSRSLIALAQTLKSVAIADGIASDADAQFFRWEGCELGQGDPLAPACAVADVDEYLRCGPRAPS